MKRIFAHFLLLAAALLFLPAASNAHVVEGITVIHMDDNGFSPDTVTIDKGDTIEFENVGAQIHWPASNVHPTHDIYPAFDPKKPVQPGESWSFTFDRVGTWKFHDHIYPQFGGSITVNGASSTSQPGFFSRVASAIGKFFSDFFNFLTGKRSNAGTR